MIPREVFPFKRNSSDNKLRAGGKATFSEKHKLKSTMFAVGTLGEHALLKCTKTKMHFPKFPMNNNESWSGSFFNSRSNTRAVLLGGPLPSALFDDN